MGARTSAVLSAVLVCLVAGCGGDSGSMTMSQDPVANLASGNWAFLPANPLAGSSISIPPFLGGSLMNNGGQLSADFLLALPIFTACPLTTSSSFDVAFTGSLKGSQMTLTSSPWNSGMFTVTGTVATDGNSFGGSWSVKGGCADGASGTVTASYVPAVTGTWTGVLAPFPAQTSSPLTGSTATLQLVQAGQPTRFSFPLSGSITLSGSNCPFTSGTFIQLPGGDPLEPSSITGDEITAEAQMNDGQSQVIAVAVPSSAGTWVMAMSVFGGVCDGATGTATLTRQ